MRKKNCELGEGFVKILSCHKTCVGDGGELGSALDDVYGTGVTVRSCCEKRFEKKKTLQKSLKFSDCRKSIRKQIRPSCRKPFDFFLNLFGFVKARKFRDSSEISDCVQNV